MDMFGLVERHALKVHALQPKPELEGAAQALPEDAKMDTTFSAGCSQPGHVAVVSCVLSSFSNVLLHDVQWNS